ncbi:MAG: acetylxylan esterase [Muribaculaceae bacterium]|nr:acetylxylan esterase [Muribaculaceae bacterium]
MNKLTALLLIAASVVPAAQAHNLKVDIDKGHDLWWNAPETPVLSMSFTAAEGDKAFGSVRLTVARDTLRATAFMDTVFSVSAPARVDVPVAVPGPGFYYCNISDDGGQINETVIGYEPTNVVSLPDEQPDFDAFWQQAKAELADVPATYTLKQLTDKSGKARDLYECTFRSWGGDTIVAHIAMPRTPGKHPAIIFYNGYGGKPWPMDLDSPNDYVEMQTSVRGQFHNADNNRYGDWIQYHLNDPSTYYYKGAFMDAVRAIDVLEQLPEVDTARIYAEGGSQGGALTLAAGALCDGRLLAIAPYIPFLSDYPHYFRIVNWPASVVFKARDEQRLTDEEMYRNLSYFDIKNFARRIKMPVLMGIGLQDQTCPPHTNMSGYNLIEAPKQLRIYPECGHTVDYSDWNPRRTAFFEAAARGI